MRVGSVEVAIEVKMEERLRYIMSNVWRDRR
jgi:hypothetical protein